MLVKTKLASLIGLAVLSQTVSATAAHDVHFRYNLAGYSLERPKNIVIMTNKNFHSGNGNPSWVLKRAGVQVATGEITPGMKVAKKSEHHSPMKHSFHLDLRTHANIAGNYELTIQGENHAKEKAVFQVKADPYGDIVAEMLVHISSRRSGVQSPIKQYRDAMRAALTYSAADGPKLGVLAATESLTEEQKALALKPHYFDGTAELPVYKLRDVATTHPNYIAEKTEKNKVSNALWGEDPTVDGFDVSGGWYDAGDYIKFTLTIAHATYYMLRAYETNGELFDKHSIASSQHYDGYAGIITSGVAQTGRDAPIILDEAKFGLDFLAKTYDASRADEFVVQVGDQRDHLNEDLNGDGKRLPIYDGTRHVLAGAAAAQGITDKRPILSALSPGHMGLTLAALSLGAKVFEDAGYTEDANRYRAKAKELYERMFAANTKNGQTKAGILIANAHSYETTTGTDATANGVAQGASCVDFSYATLEKSNITNNFYNDSVYCAPELPGLYRRKDSANQKTTYDNLGLGVVEYYRITNKKNVLANANSLANKAGIAGWASWSNVNLSLHYRLAELKQANNKFKSEIDSFRSYSNRTGGGLDSANNLFGLPQQIVWSSLGNHLIAAPYSALGTLLDNNGNVVTSQVDPKSNLLYNVLDYTLGRNNWGVSMVYSNSVNPNDRLEKYYNWIYTKLKLPTVGAVSQGPASKSDYESQATNGMTPVSAAEKKKRDKFNTSGAVFYEYSKNWVNMEAMAYQQAAALYTLAVATKLEGVTDDTGGPSNNKPSINWSGSQSASVLVFETVIFNVQAADSDGELESVTFSILDGSEEVSSFVDIDVSDAQFSHSWIPDQVGAYTVIASALDDEGAVSEVSHSFAVTDVEVDVQLTLSSTAVVVNTDEQFTLTADVEGQSADLVESVGLFVDNAEAGPMDSTSPFDFTHSIASAGSYTVSVKGFGADGNVIVQSDELAITVNAIGGGSNVTLCSSLGLSLNPSTEGGVVANTYNKKGAWHRKSWSGATKFNHSKTGDYMLDGEFVYKIIDGSWVGLVPTNPQYNQYWNQWEKVCSHQ